MLGIDKLAGAVVWTCLIVVNWFQRQFVHPIAEWWLETVLGTWEESVKSVIRELFAQMIRIVNYFLNAIFSWFPGYTSVKRSTQKQSAWKAWWEENRQSTFNAIIERDRSVRGGLGGRGKQEEPSGQRAAATQPSRPQTSFKQRLSQLFTWNRGRSPSDAAKLKDAQISKGQRKRPIKQEKRIPAHKKIKRNGSDLFDKPAGWAVQEKAKRGFLDDWRLGAELVTTDVFDAVRWLVRKALFMPEKQNFSPFGIDGTRSGWMGDSEDDMSSPERPQHKRPRRRGSNPFTDSDSSHSWTAAEVIKATGYPLERHEVTTADGYVLLMERLPRHGARDVVFFMHGILDTSMGWVANGATGSQAFAAFDNGFDVWLGNSRANPPRKHTRRDMMGAAYWYFTVNELGEKDMAAQLDHIDATKRGELKDSVPHAKKSNEPEASAARQEEPQPQGRRPRYRVRKSHSDTALDERNMSGASGSSHAAQPVSKQPSTVVEQAENGDYEAEQAQPAGTAAPQADADFSAKPKSGLSSFLGRSKAENAATREAPSINLHVHAAQRKGAAHRDDEADEVEAFVSPRSHISSPESASPQQASPSVHQAATPAADSNGNAHKQQAAGAAHSSHHQQPASQQPLQSPFVSRSTRSPTPPVDPRDPTPSEAAATNSSPTLSSSAPSESHSFLHNWGAGASSRFGPSQSGQSLSQSHSQSQSQQFGHGGIRSDASQSGQSPSQSQSQSHHFGHVGSDHKAHASSSPRLRHSAGHHKRSKSRSSMKSSVSQERMDWSSTERLLELAPDMASHGGCERAPQQGFTVASTSRKQGDAASAAGHANHGTPLQQDKIEEEQRYGDHVDAEQDGAGQQQEHQHQAGTGSHTGSQQGSGKQDEAPYRLRAVAHSLGGASLLMYAVRRGMQGQPSHIARLILLTPAGFQQNYPKAATPFLWVIPPLVWALHWARPGIGAACYIPSSLLRYVTFKLTVDMQQIPAINEIVRAGIRVLLNGDSSEWDQAMRMPHYNTRSMPSISFHTGMHLVQWVRTGKFRMFRYRNKEANRAAYGQDTPIDIAENYGVLKMPIDIMAGRSDGIIAKENVLKHFAMLQAAKCCVTYKEFDFGHLDFTFAVKDDLRQYVLLRLRMDS